MRKVLYIFGQLDDGDIDWLLSRGRKLVLPEGSLLISRGKPVEDLYIVLDGSLSVFLDEAGREPLAVLGPGEIVGEMSFVDSSPPSATVKVGAKATLYTIARSVLRARIAEDTGFASRFFQAIAVFLADRLRSTMGLYEYRLTKKAPIPAADPDELNEMVTDGLAIAGERFKRMMDSMLRTPASRN